MTIAWVENGVVTEVRDMSMESVPEHKRALWRVVEGERPTFNAVTHRLHGPQYVVDGDRVRAEWQVHAIAPPAPADDTVARLTAEVESMRALLTALMQEARR